MLRPSTVFSPFGDDVPVRGALSGVNHGSCQFAHDGAVERVSEVSQMLGAMVFAPRVKFTNKLVDFDSLMHVDRLSDRIVRNKDNADGAFTSSKGLGLTICNADCHMGVAYIPDENRLYLLHLGLGCLVSKDGQPSLLEVFQQQSRIDQHSNAYFWVGAGIGPCCYGLNNIDPELRKLYPDAFQGVAEKGPRQGQHAVDLMVIIAKQAHRLGFSVTHQDFTCTSCAGMGVMDEGYGDYFSNVRDEEKRGDRNCFMVSLLN